MKSVSEIKSAIGAEKMRSAWQRGVREYAYELLETVADGEEVTESRLLNGAKDWWEYSWGGCSLIYDADIAERLCNPTEYKQTDGGRLKPNKREEWLDAQGRALFQAWLLIARCGK